MNPTIGRIVHFVQNSATQPKLIHLPAIIVAVWGPTCVNLQVFTDGYNSEPAGGEGTQPPSLKLITSVSEDATAQTARSWHWPEREEAQ